MRRIIFLVAVLFSFNAAAQKLVWNQDIPLDCKRINIEFDYSNTLFRGMSYNENVENEEDFTKGIKEAENRFITSFNDYTYRYDFFLSRLDEYEYSLIVIPSIIRSDGDFMGEIIIKNKFGEDIAYMKKIWKTGGTFGSFYNLMGDGYESVAEMLAAKICSHRRKQK